MARAGQRGTPRAAERPLAAIPMPRSCIGRMVAKPMILHRPEARVSRPEPGTEEGIAVSTVGRPILLLHIVESLA